LLLLAVCGAQPLVGQCPDGTPPPCGAAPRVLAAARTPGSNSIAVLPLENRARDTSLTLLAEGLADQVTTNLEQIARVAMAPPASVRYVLDHSPREPARLGRALSVRWLVDGQMLPGRGSVRLTVQLIDASAGRVRWSGSFQRPTDDLFAVISAVAESVATAVVGALQPAEQARLRRRPTMSNAALLAYTRGVAALHHFDESDQRLAVSAFEEAIAADSAFAPAWSGLAEAWFWSDPWYPPRQIYPRGRAAAERALALDPNSSTALAALAGFAYCYDWNLPRAEALARRAIQRDSSNGRAWLYLGEALVAERRVDEAAVAYERSMAVDTLDEAVAMEASGGLAMAHRADEALAVARRWRAREPGETWALNESLILLRAHRCRAEPPAMPIGPLALACAGRREAARALADSLAAGAERGEWTQEFLDLAYVALGDRDAALHWLARAIDARVYFVVFLAVDPIWDDWRGDPRFTAQLDRIRSEAQ
jgi:serine/threonine-protein kinase